MISAVVPFTVHDSIFLYVQVCFLLSVGRMNGYWSKRTPFVVVVGIIMVLKEE